MSPNNFENILKREIVMRYIRTLLVILFFICVSVASCAAEDGALDYPPKGSITESLD